MVYTYTVVLERNDGGGYTVTVPALKGCVTQGETWAEAIQNAREALQSHLEGLAILGKRIPADIKSVRLGTDTSDEILVVKVRVNADTKPSAGEKHVASAAQNHLQSAPARFEADGVRRNTPGGKPCDPPSPPERESPNSAGACEASDSSKNPTVDPKARGNRR